jgi:hypothetical protein
MPVPPSSVIDRPVTSPAASGSAASSVIVADPPPCAVPAGRTAMPLTFVTFTPASRVATPAVSPPA